MTHATGDNSGRAVAVYCIEGDSVGDKRIRIDDFNDWLSKATEVTQ